MVVNSVMYSSLLTCHRECYWHCIHWTCIFLICKSQPCVSRVREHAIRYFLYSTEMAPADFNNFMYKTYDWIRFFPAYMYVQETGRALTLGLVAFHGILGLIGTLTTFVKIRDSKYSYFYNSQPKFSKLCWIAISVWVLWTNNRMLSYEFTKWSKCYIKIKDQDKSSSAGLHSYQYISM